MRLSICLLATFLISGCATTKGYQEVLETWVGSSADDLVSSWGPPTSVYELSNGGKVIQYNRSNTGQVGGYTYQSPETTYHNGSGYSSGQASAYDNYGNSAHATSSGYSSYNGSSTTYTTKTTPVYNVTYTCNTRFTTDSAGKIVKWSHQGNSCKQK